MKLRDRWYACEDGRTLQEFVADYRAAARATRHQAKMATAFLGYLQEGGPRDSAWLAQMQMRQVQQRYPGGLIGSTLGGLLG